MPEFKLVVNDPEVKRVRPIPVRIKGSEELSYTEEHKEGRKLMEGKVNSRTYEMIGSPYGIATLRIWKGGEKGKVNVTLRLVKEDSLPDLVIEVPSGFLEEKIGQEEVDGEIFRSKAFQITVSGDKATLLLEKRIGDVIDGAPFGFTGKRLLITGGSDNTGFPMVKTLPGGSKRKILLSGPPGYRPEGKGVRRRKFVRGNMITDEIVQINTKLVSEAS